MGSTQTDDLERKWAKHADAWRLRFPWLTAKKHSDGSFGLGCAFCAHTPSVALQGNAWVTCRIGFKSAQPSNMQGHQMSSIHKQAAGAVGDDTALEYTAPPLSQLAAAVEAVWKGQSHIEAVGPFKFRNLIWCAAEVPRCGTVK